MLLTINFLRQGDLSGQNKQFWFIILNMFIRGCIWANNSKTLNMPYLITYIYSRSIDFYKINLGHTEYLERPLEGSVYSVSGFAEAINSAMWAFAGW